MNDKWLIKVLVIALLLQVQVWALQEQEIKSTMMKKVAQVTALIKNESLSEIDKMQQILALVDPLFDYALMSRIALGKHWKMLSKKEQEAFKTIFTSTLQTSYLGKLKLYTNEKVEMNEIIKPKSNRIELYSKIIGADKNYTIMYKFYYDKKNKDWLIYDIHITGVSIMKAYRKQFSEFLSQKRFEDLLKELEKKHQSNINIKA